MDEFTESGSSLSHDRESKTPFIFGLLLLAGLAGGGAYWFFGEDQTKIAGTAEAAQPLVTAEITRGATKAAANPGRQVYFAYDDASLTTETKAVLDQWAERLAADKLLTVQIEGHCDERGSNGYNMTLGERRGDAVRDYLVAKGINEPRLRVVSFGESRPVDSRRGESAWSANRRVEFRIANVISQR